VKETIVEYLLHYPHHTSLNEGFTGWEDVDFKKLEDHKEKLKECIDKIERLKNGSAISNKIVNLVFKHLKYIQQYTGTDDRKKKTKLLANIHGIHDTPINIFSVIDAATSTISGNLSNDNIELLYDDFENEANFYPAFKHIGQDYHQIKLSIGNNDTFLHSIQPSKLVGNFELNVYPSYSIYKNKIWKEDTDVKNVYKNVTNFINPLGTYGWLYDSDDFSKKKSSMPMNQHKDVEFTSSGKTKKVYPFELKLPGEKVERWVILKIASTRIKFENVVTTYLNSHKINGIKKNNIPQFVQLYPSCTKKGPDKTKIDNKNIMRLRSKFAVLVKYNTDKYMVICNAAPQNPIVAKLTQLIELCTLDVGTSIPEKEKNSNKILLSIMNYKRIMDSLQYYGLYKQVERNGNKKGIFITGDRSCFFQAMFLRNKDNKSNIDVYYNNKNEERKCLKFNPSQGNGRFVFGRRRRFGKGPFDSPPKSKFPSPKTEPSNRILRRPSTGNVPSAFRRLQLVEPRLKSDKYMNDSKRIQESDTKFLKIKKNRAIIKEVTEICGLLEEEFIDYFLTIENNKVVLKYFLHPVIKYYYKKDDYVKKKLDSLLSKDYIIQDEEVTFVRSTKKIRSQEGGSNNKTNNMMVIDDDGINKSFSKTTDERKRDFINRSPSPLIPFERTTTQQELKQITGKFGKKKRKKVKKKRKKVKKKRKKVKRKRKT